MSYIERLNEAVNDVQFNKLTVVDVAHKYCLPIRVICGELGYNKSNKVIDLRRKARRPRVPKTVLETALPKSENIEVEEVLSSQSMDEDNDWETVIFADTTEDVADNDKHDVQEIDAEEHLLDDICRGCKTKDPTILDYIFKPEIYDLFKQCTGLDPSRNRNLSNAICITCIERLHEWRSFRQQCEETELLLQQECEASSKEDNISCESQNDEEDKLCLDNSLSNREYFMNNSALSDFKADRFYCEICFRSYGSESKYKSHLLFHDYIKDLKCRLCDSSFDSPHKLDTHCKTIHPNNIILNYECKQCGKYYAKYLNMRNHISIVHDKAKPNLCSFCGMQFFSKTKMAEHITRMHTPEAPKIFKCNECHKAFSTRTALGNHSVFHNEPLLKCDVCFKGFKTKNNLIVHSIVHAKVVQCPNCLLRCKNVIDYKDHIKSCMNEPPRSRSPPPDFRTSHAKPVCPLCKEELKNITTLEQHLKDNHIEDEGVDIQEVLESVKTKQCDKCNKKFFDDYALYYHKSLRHTDVRFKCLLCFKLFRTRSILRVHMANSCKGRDSKLDDVNTKGME